MDFLQIVNFSNHQIFITLGGLTIVITTIGVIYRATMLKRLELRNRLLLSVPKDILFAVKPSLAYTEQKLNERLYAELAEPTIIQVEEGWRYLELSVGGDLAAGVTALIDAQPANYDVAINLFPRTGNHAIQGFQEAFLEAAFMATTVLVGCSQSSKDRIDDIIRLSASATSAGRIFRETFSDPNRKPPPIDFLPGELPDLPGLPDKLLINIEDLFRRGCVEKVKIALNRWGEAVRQATPRYLNNVISSINPPDNCPGEEIMIFGEGMGDGTRSVVVFTGSDGRVIITPPTSILEWTEVHIRLIIPKSATRGPIGILIYPESSGSFVTAASAARAEIGTCFGPEVLMRMDLILGRITAPPIVTPNEQANGANIYKGGVPVIWFNITPNGPLWPGRLIRLSWSIDYADSIEIIARNVDESLPHELPIINSPLPHVSGSVSVTVPGTRPWRGKYVLRAQNRCGVAESTIELEMVLRKGLALGGGGTRGDFQVGALLYLYEEKNFRPDAIASSSVGSINAIDLSMGDDPAYGRSAAARLASTWLSLREESDMWDLEEWFKKARNQVKQFVRSLSLEGLLLLPYSVASGVIKVNELSDLFKDPRKKGVFAIFNLKPIEALARGFYNQARTNASGIKLRLVSISIETGEFVMVDENGRIRQRGPQPSRPPSVPAAPSTDMIDGAIASASIPGIFPARRLADHMCVDGGVKELVPVKVAVRDLGCNHIIAIRCSAKPTLEATDPYRSFGQVMARSLLDLTYDAIVEDDVAPFGGWTDGVSVIDIFPSFNLHDPMVVEPGLIRIAIDYGWMRAADILDVPERLREYAMELSNRIISLRVQNWREAHWALGVRFKDPHRGITDHVLGGMTTRISETQPVPTPESVDLIRNNCRKIRAALQQRLLINAPTPDSAIRTRWFTEWENIRGIMVSSDPWTASAYWSAATPPSPI
jgi:predicted acylesterase/phospholipase RssA